MAIQTQMNLGRVRPVYKGAYNALAAYGTLDMVLYEKEIWMMVARSYTPGDLPVDSGNGMSASGAWAKIGYQGERGLQGETGPIGPYYRPSVAVDGTFSWTNDGGLVNPDPVKIDLYWHQISGTCTQVSTTQFTVAGTESAIVEGRGVRFNDSLLAHISAVTVENDVTTVTVDSAVVPATILKVEVGVISIDMLPTITGFLPLSGGVISSGDYSISLFPFGIEIGAPSPYIDFHHANSVLDNTARLINDADGRFLVTITNDTASEIKSLALYSNGNLTWDGKDVSPVSTISMMSQNLSVEYMNKLQFDARLVGVQDGDSWTFMKAFAEPPCVVLCQSNNLDGVFAPYDVTTTGFKVHSSIPVSAYGFYIAIGKGV